MNKIFELRKSLLFLLFVFFLVLNFAFAAFAVEAKKTYIHSKVWKENFRENYSYEMCDEDHYVMNCYKITETNCRTKVQTLTASCFSQIKIPEKVNPYANGVVIASRIGMCVAHELHKQLKDSANGNKRCPYFAAKN